MPNLQLKTVTLPSGDTYDIVDAGARALIQELENYTDYLGVTTTELEDGSTTNPITIEGESVTAKKGNIANYGSKEFIFNGTSWQEFGDLSGLGELAFENSAEGKFTPQGSVSKPDIDVTPTTSNIEGIDSVGTLPSATMPTFTYANENLTITAGSFNAGSLPTKATAVAAVTGVTAELHEAPTFNGTEGTVTVSAPV